MSRHSLLSLTCPVFSLLFISIAAQAPAKAQDDLVQADAPLVRKNFTDFAKNKGDLDSFKNAILKMMGKDCKGAKKAPACEQELGGTGVKADKDLDPTGWKYQASIHGSFPNADDQKAWDTCQHSSWTFLSWHRLELYYFERILRAASAASGGNRNLTLPYWNFSLADPDLKKMCQDMGMADNCVGARLPAAFRSDPAGNPLYWPYRDSKLNMAPPAKPTDPDPAMPLCHDVVTTEVAFKQTDFYNKDPMKGLMSFGGGAINAEKHLPKGNGRGQIENLPHDDVHVAVAGKFNDEKKRELSLLNQAGAGLDPIFWPIHANIDRAWSCWQRKHPGSEPKEDFWQNHPFTFFKENGKENDGKDDPKSGKDVIKTKEQLNYEYDDPCAGFEVPGSELTPDQLANALAAVIAAESSHPLSVTAEFPTVLTSEPVTIAVDLPPEIQERIQALVLAGAPAGAILLTVEGLAVDRPSGAAYEVYLDLPQEVIPRYQSPYLVGELPFFGIGHTHHMDIEDGHIASEPASLTFDLTDAVRQLVLNGEWRGDQVLVTFANSVEPVDIPCVKPSTATPSDRARFSSLTLTVN